MKLAHRTWTEVPHRPLVLLPVGSTEQHGPHLPIATDTIIAVAVADAVVAGSDSQGALAGALVAPAIAFGASGEHQDFPGTASAGTEAFGAYLLEVVRSLSTWAGRIVVVNGHGGNVPALASVVPRLIDEQHRVAWAPCGAPGSDAHAGRTETSLMLHLDASSVRGESFFAGNTSPISELMPELRKSGVRAVSPTGILGDPNGATADEGAAILGQIVESVRRRILHNTPDARGCLSDPGAT
ncbi:MAG TPA: mycofactocin biosynthesis peptidyl-dipeptidase MftE [Pseudolysinimonas sp.]|nr:mycofactocin biosynthesis peptidyl-dipeptidase MftE [Pseudolysinimonas sp.]